MKFIILFILLVLYFLWKARIFMNKFLTYVQKELNYSDYQIALLRYFFEATFYDFSKLIILGFFFGFIGYTFEYFVAVITLMLLRTSVGGLHFNTYSKCFAFTFAFLILGVIFLPLVTVGKLTMLIALFVCVVITNIIGPITSSYRKTPTGVLIQNSKRKASHFIFFYCLLVFIIPLNKYIITGFWVIILQTLQLAVAFILKSSRCKCEEQIT